MTEKKQFIKCKNIYFQQNSWNITKFTIHSGKLFNNKIVLHALYTENIFKQNSLKLLPTYRI